MPFWTDVSIRFPRFYFLLILSGPLLTTIGCSDGDGRKTAAVSGTVTCGGQPLPGGSLLFVPDGGGPTAQGKIQPDGTYTMGTYTESDGAILGTHKVMITAYVEPTGSGLPEDAIKKRDEGVPVPLIPEHYGDLEQSGLTATVTEGDNQIDFELTDSHS